MGKFRRSGRGKTIAEWSIDGRPAVLKMDTRTYIFRVEVDGTVFEGDTARELMNQADMFVRGQLKVEWQPMIVIETEPYNFELDYYRAFHAVVNRRVFWRYWDVRGVSERGSRSHDFKETADIMEGNPGELRSAYDSPKITHRTIPYTAERWRALRALDQNLKETLVKIKERLTEILSTANLDRDLVKMATTPALLFKSDKPEKAEKNA